MLKRRQMLGAQVSGGGIDAAPAAVGISPLTPAAAARAPPCCGHPARHAHGAGTGARRSARTAAPRHAASAERATGGAVGGSDAPLPALRPDVQRVRVNVPQVGLPPADQELRDAMVAIVESHQDGMTPYGVGRFTPHRRHSASRR